MYSLYVVSMKKVFYSLRHLYSLFNIQACNLIRLIMTKSNIFCIYFLFKHYFKGINKFFIMENTNNKLKTIIMSVKHLLKCMWVIVITSVTIILSEEAYCMQTKHVIRSISLLWTNRQLRFFCQLVFLFLFQWAFLTT
jgi:hypothetical protein